MDWEGAVQQLIQNQQNFGQAFAQFLTHQANVGPAGPLPAKKIVATPEAYNGSPQKFHEWWSKVKVWIATTHATATNEQKAVAVYSRLEGPCAGHFAQVRLDECMVAVLDINIFVVYLPDYISTRVHYSRLCSTIVPSVACQTTEGEYHLLTILLLTDTL